MFSMFSFKNVLSFPSEVTLDLRAVDAYDEHPTNLIQMDCKPNVLRVEAVYGANASGKSNLFFALVYFRSIVMESSNNVDDHKFSAVRKYYFPFKFCENHGDSEFEAQIICHENVYTYGFAYNSKRIEKEWLYSLSQKTHRTSVILERDGDECSFGASVRRECVRYQNMISTDALALSLLGKTPLKAQAFREVFDEIRGMILVPAGSPSNTYQILQQLLPEEVKKRKAKLLRFLNAIDSGISDISIDNSVKDHMEIYSMHKGRNGENYSLDIRNESDGTLKAVVMYLFSCAAIQNNHLMVVDEMNNKLHPLLLKLLVDQFYDEGTMAQLVYTTHDTTLLDRRFFRRDQINFVQKNEYGCSALYSLSDFKVRKDASFEKDYLAGVYGGIPRLRSINNLNEGDNGR